MNSAVVALITGLLTVSIALLIHSRVQRRSDREEFRRLLAALLLMTVENAALRSQQPDATSRSSVRSSRNTLRHLYLYAAIDLEERIRLRRLRQVPLLGPLSRQSSRLTSWDYRTLAQEVYDDDAFDLAARYLSEAAHLVRPDDSFSSVTIQRQLGRLYMNPAWSKCDYTQAETHFEASVRQLDGSLPGSYLDYACGYSYQLWAGAAERYHILTRTDGDERIAALYDEAEKRIARVLDSDLQERAEASLKTQREAIARGQGLQVTLGEPEIES